MDRILVVFAAPAIVLMTVVLLVPSVFTVIISLTKWRGFGTDVAWVGLRNYVSLWQSEIFRTAMLNTLILVFVGGAMIFAVVFFMLIGLRHMRGAGFARSVVFVPMIISPIAIGAALGFLLNPNGGVNAILAAINLEGLRQAWLAPDFVFRMIVLGLVWSVSGYYLAIVATGADQIPIDLYEEADLAGASKWQQFWLVTLPLSWESTSVAVVLWLISGMKTFEIVIAFIGTQGTPPVQARTAAVQQFLATTGGPDGTPQLGQASAIGIAIFALTSVFVILARRILSRDRVELS
ncbi:carbohydrate ABC transporter permease [Occultella gossypii]|uniref:Sugar ABC transporter permease n=1 Tax=Occultella gossypii TaxID=2800820 RepID=A0ABS7SF07_9MICO|nr:sugar ABC transporter permease [Occultella gossypii]MBZ2197876.1 sugar ABC transporter permease [Occultella gossypii]